MVILELIFSATAYSQQPGGASSPQIVTPLIQPQSTPQQQKAVQEAIEQKGLTPEAIEILKAKPEFQGLKPDDILKAKRSCERKKRKSFPINRLSAKIKAKPLFERYRITGNQNIQMDPKPFGYEFFRDAAVKVITDRKDVPVPSEYVVGTGDEVKISVMGKSQCPT